MSPVLVMLLEEGVGGRECFLSLLLFVLGWVRLVAGAGGVAPLGAGHGQFRLATKELPRPPLLLWRGCVGL